MPTVYMCFNFETGMGLAQERGVKYNAAGFHPEEVHVPALPVLCVHLK